MRAICKKFMKSPFEITIDNEVGLTLHGLQQYYSKLEENQKNRKLGLWMNASKLGLGDVTSKQQIATEWNTRT